MQEYATCEMLALLLASTFSFSFSLKETVSAFCKLPKEPHWDRCRRYRFQILSFRAQYHVSVVSVRAHNPASREWPFCAAQVCTCLPSRTSSSSREFSFVAQPDWQQILAFLSLIWMLNATSLCKLQTTSSIKLEHGCPGMSQSASILIRLLNNVREHSCRIFTQLNYPTITARQPYLQLKLPSSKEALSGIKWKNNVYD